MAVFCPACDWRGNAAERTPDRLEDIHHEPPLVHPRHLRTILAHTQDDPWVEGGFGEVDVEITGNRDGPLEMENVATEQRIRLVAQRLLY